jgi:hypothetical protein
VLAVWRLATVLWRPGLSTRILLTAVSARRGILPRSRSITTWRGRSIVRLLSLVVLARLTTRWRLWAVRIATMRLSVALTMGRLASRRGVLLWTGALLG